MKFIHECFSKTGYNTVGGKKTGMMIRENKTLSLESLVEFIATPSEIINHKKNVMKC